MYSKLHMRRLVMCLLSNTLWTVTWSIRVNHQGLSRGVFHVFNNQSKAMEFHKKVNESLELLQDKLTILQVKPCSPVSYAMMKNPVKHF